MDSAKNGNQGAAGTDFTRREFLRLGLMTSALLALDPFAGAEASSSVPWHGVLQPLAPGVVRPEGWLRSYLEKQAAELGSQLPAVSWPFSSAYWAGETQAESWWPWEQTAYWLDGACRLALVLDDRALLAQVNERLAYTLNHADADGYLGPASFKEPKANYHRWPHALFFRSLAAMAESGAQPGAIADAMRRHYLSDKALYGTPVRNIANVESMLWCYERTGDLELLALADTAWQQYGKVAGDMEHGDLSELRVFAATPINAHGVTYIETAKQPAILYIYTGDEKYLEFALAAQRRIFDHHMLVDGIPSTSELYRTVTSLDSHETCDIADHTWSWGYMLMATGDGVWGDRIERACFNAAPGAIKNDWKAVQYFSCPNQFLATLDSDHNVMEHGSRLMAYQPNPGQKTACCGGNVHRIFPNYAIRMWMKTNDGGVAAVLYGASSVKLTVGKDSTPIEIVQTTSYPFEEQIAFTIHCSYPVAFPLSLRIPAWCSAPRLAINQSRISMPPIVKGFAVLHRTFSPGDTITLTLPMKLAVTRWPQSGIAVERGPLVFSLPIQENWSAKVEPKFTTEDFPSLEARPASDWNYGLSLRPGDLEAQVHTERAPIGLDPWSHPPISLAVPARKIEGWELQSNPDKPDQKFTPGLPDMTTSKVGESLERIKLTPYGCTQLRVTIFPEIPSDLRASISPRPSAGA